MATFNYAKLSKTVANLIEKFGHQVSIERTVVSSYDKSLNKFVFGASATGVMNAVELPVTSEDLQNMDFKTTQEGFKIEDCKILYADVISCTLAPEPEDIMDIGDGDSWRVLSVSKLAPAGDSSKLLYTIGIYRQ